MKRLNGVEKMLKNKLKEVRKVYPQACIKETCILYKNREVITFYVGGNEFEYQFSKGLYYTLNAGRLSCVYYERLSDLKSAIEFCQRGGKDKLKFKALAKNFGIVVTKVKVKRKRK